MSGRLFLARAARRIARMLDDPQKMHYADMPMPLSDIHTRNARLFANRNDMLASFRDRLENAVIAEVGVAFGDFSEFMIHQLKPRRFDAYDVFQWKAGDIRWNKDCDETFKGKSHLEYYKQRLESYRYCDVRTLVGDSSTCLLTSDAQYDMIYIDGDHSIEGVERDTEAALIKIRESGILIFNDYIMSDYLGNVEYGIVHAVNKLCVDHDWRVIGFAFANHMFCDIALQKRA